MDYPQRRIQDFKGGSNSQAGVGTGGGVPPPVTARGSGGALSSPSAPAAFSLLVHLACLRMQFNV